MTAKLDGNRYSEGCLPDGKKHYLLKVGGKIACLRCTGIPPNQAAQNFNVVAPLKRHPERRNANIMPLAISVE